MNNLNNSKKIQGVFAVIGILAFIAVIAIIVSAILSPKVYLVTTARYGKGSAEDEQNVKIAFSEENTEERFKLYFQWYNVVHELGHGLLRYNSNLKLSRVQEEQLVNDFAVAYWLYYGEPEKIDKLVDITNYAASHIKSDAPEGTYYMDFAEKNFNKKWFNTFNNYGWFQFSSVKESLQKRKDLESVLKEMGINNVKLPERKTLQYPEINEDVSTQVINDAVDNFHSWGLNYPNVCHFFSNDPNENYSRSSRDYFGIWSFIEKNQK